MRSVHEHERGQSRGESTETLGDHAAVAHKRFRQQPEHAAHAHHLRDRGVVDIDERTEERKHANPEEPPFLGGRERHAGTIAVHESETVGLSRIVIRRPGQRQRREVSPDLLGESDRQHGHRQRHQRKPVRQEAVIRGCARLRVQTHGRRREVRVVEHDEHRDHSSRVELGNEAAQPTEQQERKRKAAADEEQIDDRMKEHAAQGREPKRLTHAQRGSR